jgi:hypothetical protein
VGKHGAAKRCCTAEVAENAQLLLETELLHAITQGAEADAEKFRRGCLVPTRFFKRA